MSTGFFDEKAIVALAFFVCVGLIIKFFGKNFINFLSEKQNEISQNITSVENKLNIANQKIQNIKLNEENILEKNAALIENAKREKDFIIQNSEEKSAMLLNESVENQKLLNQKRKRYNFENETKSIQISNDQKIQINKLFNKKIEQNELKSCVKDVTNEENKIDINFNLIDINEKFDIQNYVCFIKCNLKIYLVMEILELLKFNNINNKLSSSIHQNRLLNNVEFGNCMNYLPNFIKSNDFF